MAAELLRCCSTKLTEINKKAAQEKSVELLDQEPQRYKKLVTCNFIELSQSSLHFPRGGASVESFSLIALARCRSAW